MADNHPLLWAVLVCFAVGFLGAMIHDIFGWDMDFTQGMANAIIICGALSGRWAWED